MTKADSRACEAGTFPHSEMPFLSQKQGHISSLVPYMVHVSSSHVCNMVSFTHSCLFALAVTLLGGTGCVLVGTHILSWSLVRQCSHSIEGFGVRFWGYGASFLGVVLDVSVWVGCMGRLRGLVLLVFQCLRSPDSLLTQFSLGSRLHAKSLIAVSCARLLWVCVGEERPDLQWHWEDKE